LQIYLFLVFTNILSLLFSPRCLRTLSLAPDSLIAVLM